jgi:hypothetical protein
MGKIVEIIRLYVITGVQTSTSSLIVCEFIMVLSFALSKKIYFSPQLNFSQTICYKANSNAIIWFEVQVKVGSIVNFPMVEK